MEKFVEGLKVIDQMYYSSPESFGAIFPEGWAASLLLLSGTVAIEVKNANIYLSSGEVILIAPPFTIVAISGPLLVSAACFTYDFAIASKVIKTGRGSLNYTFIKPYYKLALTKKQTERFAGRIKAIHKNADNPHKIPFQKELLLLWFNLLLYEFSSLYLRQHNETAFKTNRKDELFLNFIEMVQQHCKKEHGVRFYADGLFITTGYLGKVVREVSSGTAKHYIEMAIVSEAYVLLADTARTIADISDELNFTSVSSFSNFFKRYTQVSPRVYREAL